MLGNQGLGHIVAPSGVKQAYISLVAGKQLADAGETVYKTVGSTTTTTWTQLGNGTPTHSFRYAGVVPVSSTGYVQIYDATNHATIHESALLNAGEFDVTTAVTLAAGATRLEIWIKTQDDAGGNLSLYSATLVSTFG